MTRTTQEFLTLAALSVAAMAQPELPYLETKMENGSPLWWELIGERQIRIHLVYDQERNSPNRAAGHIYTVLHAPSGTTWTLEFTNLLNVWNGRSSSAANEMSTLYVSPNGREWSPVATEILHSNCVRLAVTMPGPCLHIARVEPYRLSDLERLLEELRRSPRVTVEVVGQTVQGRPLEMVTVGAPTTTCSIVLRARAHPWESGGNWVVQGLLRRLVSMDVASQRLLTRCKVCVLPMANKDGVVAGWTRFNARGADLNRKWDVPADPEVAPENAAFERWLERELAANRRPALLIDLHNDGHGKLHLPAGDEPALKEFRSRMERLEAALRQYTWFSEGHSIFSNPGTFGEGIWTRYGLDAVVLELNANWIANRSCPPSGALWEEFGAGLVEVFHDYLEFITTAEPAARH